MTYYLIKPGSVHHYQFLSEVDIVVGDTIYGIDFKKYLVKEREINVDKRSVQYVDLRCEEV
jgi:hypothetical protein